MKCRLAAAIAVTMLMISNSPWAAETVESADNFSEPARIRIQDMSVVEEVPDGYDVEFDTSATASQILAESNKDIQDSINMNRPW